MSQSPAESLARPTPQHPTGAAIGGCALPFGLAWTAFSLIFVIVPLAVLITEWQTSHLLQTTGVSIEAVVISRRINEDSDGNTYYITYRYEVMVKGDRTHLTHEESVDKDTYQELAPESRVTVRYSATNPDVVQLEGRSRTLEVILLLGMMLMGSLFALVGGWQIYSSLKGIYRARILAQRGQVATGTVTDCWIETDSDGDKEYCVAFRFVAPGQPEITVAHYYRKAYDTLQVGDSVQVRYVPGQPDICNLKL